MALSAFETLLKTPISEYCANDMGYRQMLRLMSINAEMRDERDSLHCIGISGISNRVSDETALYEPSYINDNGLNYLQNFQRNDAPNGGTNVTVNNPKSPYGANTNLFYDDNGTGSGPKFSVHNKTGYFPQNNNKNSIIYKTKKLFEQRRINTIISRFHTDNVNNRPNSVSESAYTKNYQYSHGRNLLTYDAENRGGIYDKNGYNNPYCRVWTHHHQYLQARGRMMRPFSVEDENGNYVVRKTSDVHKWTNFQDDENIEWSWKNEGARSREHSVLNNDTGTLNIAPKFKGGKEKNIHPKDCMFSIENFAWKDYDPYSFEKALSWEQRGPFGGRIMWFPPYGLKFSENTSVQWSENSFIGRGENVYTYTNTTRSGTLDFMLVVDHPAILDYATWHDPNNLKDTDVLRFFAGCDGGSGVNGGENGILQTFAKPTPLTDEYVEKPAVLKEPIKNENKKKKSENSDEEIEVVFYTFFPNNYSGYFDRKKSTGVDPIAYLLYGIGAQEVCDRKHIENSRSLELSFKGLANNKSGHISKGYEMSSPLSGPSPHTDLFNKKNYIVGTGYPHKYSANKYTPNINKTFYHRIDGEYVGGINYESVENTFGQYLIGVDEYADVSCFNLNSDVGAVRKNFNEKSNYLYSLSEIAYVLSDNREKINELFEHKINKEDERIKRLIDMLSIDKNSSYTVSEISAVGYSNEHGVNKESVVNTKRNQFLAKERCNTVVEWFKENYGGKGYSVGSLTNEPSKDVLPDDIKNINSISAKKWRSARITIKIKKTSSKSVNQTNNLDSVFNNQTNQEFIDFVETGDTVEYQGREVKLYHNLLDRGEMSGRKWVFDEKTSQMVLFEKKTRERVNYNEKTKEYEGDMNNLRYDQEYHFFKELQSSDPLVFKSLVKKLQYFDPAFHSMTPEGFNSRLTFLNQCLRQGDTFSASDKNGETANNLAFGRPPYCVLRIGDFLYQKILITNMSITYEPLIMDLNQEGNGVQPMLANVSLSFIFIGGGDIQGSIARLQNANSFNYYANSRFYDNRADRVSYEPTNWETMGAVGNSRVDYKNSNFYNMQRYHNEKE